MKIVKLMNEDNELSWREGKLRIVLINDAICKNNLFLMKEKGKYQTYDGKIFKFKNQFLPVEIQEIPFSILCSFQNCNSIQVKTIYLDVNDHPFCAWRRRKNGWFEYYQELFRKFNITDVDFSRDFELYDRVALLRDDNFARLCIEFFEEDFLFYSTDFFRRLFIILTSTNLTVDKLREKTEWIKTKKVKSILMSILAIIPTNVEEYLEEVVKLDYDFSSADINDLKYLSQVYSFQEVEFILLVNFFIDNGVNFNVEANMDNFKGNNFISRFEQLVKLENQFCVEVYIKLATKFNFRINTDINISFATVMDYRENCISEFYKQHSCYVNMFVISKSLSILGISIELKELIKLRKSLYQDYLEIFLNAKNFPLDIKIIHIIFSFLKN